MRTNYLFIWQISDPIGSLAWHLNTALAPLIADLAEIKSTLFNVNNDLTEIRSMLETPHQGILATLERISEKIDQVLKTKAD